MSQYSWISAEVMPSTTEGDKEMGTGDKEEDHQPEEMYLHQGTEIPLKCNASTVEKRDTMHEIAPRKDSSLKMKGIIGKQISLTYRKKENRTTRCRMPKNQILWHQSEPNWRPCPLKTRCI